MRDLSLQLKSVFVLSFVVLLSGCSAGPEMKPFSPPVYPPAPAEPRFIYERSLMGTIDVEPVTSEQKFKAMATGVPINETAMVKPFDVAVHQGKVYVSDTVERCIVLFDIPGKRFVQFGMKGPGKLQKPIGISIDEAGQVYVADVASRRVVVFDGQGAYVTAFGGPEEMVRPTDVAVSPDGRHAFVVDTGGIDSESHQLLMYELASGKLLKKIGQRGARNGDFNLPLTLDIDSKGRVYVLDAGNFRVQRFTPDGEFDFSFGEIGTRFGQFSRPKGIAVDNDGNVYVFDSAFSNFQIFNDEGKLLLFIGERSFDNEPGKFALPAGITVDEDGRIYAVDQVFTKVEVFRPYGLKRSDGYAGVEEVVKK